MESVVDREISKFERIYINRTLRHQRVGTTIGKVLLCGLIAAIFLPWVILFYKSKLVILSSMIVVGFMIRPISNMFKNITIYDNYARTCQTVIDSQTQTISSGQPGAETHIQKFYVYGKELLIPPGSEGVVSECEDKEVTLTYVACHQLHTPSLLKCFMFPEGLILLALHCDDETLIDIHNMLKIYGTRPFASNFMSNLVTLVSMIATAALFFYCWVEVDWLHGNGFFEIVIMIGGVILWPITSLAIILIPYFLYVKIRKIFNPYYREDPLSYEEKLKGKTSHIELEKSDLFTRK
ncbi:hypothetical protein [Celerinatantimonas diazotrophica]|uniref:Uncharacterized protein n=1 Tax=Celerinatantimonas diazotrophica TaxID=412034 RepID=A0A4R1JLG3_9GAMM|nr:hypothetical protein [Celerinatantimonas diazotrophica]TCK51892.1 hypothetical protein EV690_1977 [Celerinatantimonas diazotrophica]CAG9296414.1 hypothetical protein CEDIAZO_01565 [Celerinatantimonas diazotrophica]